jgi:hypothetical protein
MAEGYPGWNLLKSWTTLDEVHTTVIYILLLPLGYPWMEPTEEVDYFGRNLLCSHLHAAVSIGLPADGAYRGDEPFWTESRLRPGTAAMDGMDFCGTYCNSSFYYNMWQFYNNMRPFL